MGWGQTSAARRAERAATSADRFFLKTFRDKETRVRFVIDDPYNNWFEFKEHFDRFTRAKGARSDGISYPCAKPTGAQICLGCDYPLPDDHNPNPGVDDKGKELKCKCRGCQVREVSSRWIVPVIDEKDFLSLYKIGVRLWQDLCGSHELFHTITNCDYAVVKTGDTFNNTQYSAKPLPGTEGERKPKIRIPDYDRLLRNKYLEAIEAYEVDPAAIGFDVSSAAPEAPEEAHDDSDPWAPEHAPDVPDNADHGPEPVADGTEPDDTPPAALQGADELVAALTQHGVPVPADASPEQLRMLYDMFVAPKLAQAQQQAPAQQQAAPAAQAGWGKAAPAQQQAAAVGNGQAAVPAANGNGNGAGEAIDFKSWTTPDIQDYLSQPPAVEYSDRMPRSVLLSMAEKKYAAVSAGQPIS